MTGYIKSMLGTSSDQSFSTKTNFRNAWNICFNDWSSTFDHLWHYGFLSFNKLFLCYFFSFYLHVCSSPTHRIFENLPWESAARVHPRSLSWVFAAGIFVVICGRNLPWKFAAPICRGNFVFVSKSFFICVSNYCLGGSKLFFICEQNFFICETFLIKIVSQNINKLTEKKELGELDKEHRFF